MLWTKPLARPAEAAQQDNTMPPRPRATNYSGSTPPTSQAISE
jgi:hypothetical protein